MSIARPVSYLSKQARFGPDRIGYGLNCDGAAVMPQVATSSTLTSIFLSSLFHSFVLTPNHVTASIADATLNTFPSCLAGTI